MNTLAYWYYLVHLWSFLFLVFLIPGIFIGWPLRRFGAWMPAVLTIGAAAEMLTLVPAAWDFAQLVWKNEQLPGWGGEMTEGSLLLHIYLFVPVLLAISTGYFGAGYIMNRSTSRGRVTP